MFIWNSCNFKVPILPQLQCAIIGLDYGLSIIHHQEYSTIQCWFITNKLPYMKCRFSKNKVLIQWDMIRYCQLSLCHLIIITWKLIFIHTCSWKWVQIYYMASHHVGTEMTVQFLPSNAKKVTSTEYFKWLAASLPNHSLWYQQEITSR